MEGPRRQNLTLSGEISIVPLSTDIEITYPCYTVLVTGPTGAGKSTFIETLADSSQTLSLSKDQLSGYTQSVTGYKVVNMSKRHRSGIDRTVYLVDTPGFGDTKISENEIIDMICEWTRANGLGYFDKILYLIPINETRLTGTKKNIIQMLTGLLKQTRDNFNCLTFVTTMWDALCHEQAQERGNSNFAQLRDLYLKEFIDKGASIEHFMNTRDSVLDILDPGSRHSDTNSVFISRNRTPELYRNLYERISNALQRKRVLEDDLMAFISQSEAQDNLELISILERDLRENNEVLTRFIRQFSQFGGVPEGFEDDANRLLRDIHLNTQRSGHPWLALPTSSDSGPIAAPPRNGVSNATSTVTSLSSGSSRCYHLTRLKDLSRRFLKSTKHLCRSLCGS
ncbi:hypothetical protein BJ165DRAFT_1607373 [Panaeolus papilionaceus]|nr:hypothetical protein BJ165DRAFT_1607373 [Panaeolus papilionaceus]